MNSTTTKLQATNYELILHAFFCVLRLTFRLEAQRNRSVPRYKYESTNNVTTNYTNFQALSQEGEAESEAKTEDEIASKVKVRSTTANHLYCKSSTSNQLY
jgi:hypothetical protein